MNSNTMLDLVYLTSAVGLGLLAFGELFGASSVSLAGAVVFVGVVLAGFPVMTAQLVAGTRKETSAAALNLDFGV